MAQILFGPNTAPTEPNLDLNFTDLYNLRELISTPTYTAATPKYDATTSGWMLLAGGGLGYGAGSGGTVTQATSKSNAITLSKPAGQITMNAASLAAGATVGFQLNNTLIGANDSVIVVLQSSVISSSAYTVQVGYVIGSACGIFLTNRSGGALAEAVILNFAVIKGSIT